MPIVLNVTSGEPDTDAKTWTVDSRLDMRVPRRGPAAKATAIPESRIGLHDSTLQTFLDGIPPKEARRLKVTGAYRTRRYGNWGMICTSDRAPIFVMSLKRRFPLPMALTCGSCR